MSFTGTPSVMHTTSSMPASAASRMASAANGGRHVDHAGGGAGVAHGFLHGVEHRLAEMRLAAAARRDAADELRAVREALLGVIGALLAREALADDARIAIDQNAHVCGPFAARRHDIARGVGKIGGSGDGEPAVRQHVARLRRVGAFQAHDHRHLHAHVLHGGDDAFGDDVAADDAAEDVHEDRAHFRVRQDQLERRRDALGRGAAADVQEVRRLAAVQLDEIHRRHGEARAVHHAGDVAIQRDVVEVVLGRAALHRIFLRGVAQLRKLRLAEQRVRIDVDLGIERHELAGLRDDERIHLDEARVLLLIQLRRAP